METEIIIKYQQKQRWYCVTYGLASALHFMGHTNVAEAIKNIAPKTTNITLDDSLQLIV